MTADMRDQERKSWLAIRKEAALEIDPETTEVHCAPAWRRTGGSHCNGRVREAVGTQSARGDWR